MISNTESTDNFYQSITETSQNTLNFENCCEAEDYINPELEWAKESNTKLKNLDLIFVTKYYDKLKENTSSILLTDDEQIKYYRNPKLLSYEKIGSIDYWYIVLMLNDCTCAYDFTDFSRGVKLPNIEVINNILMDYEFITSE